MIKGAYDGITVLDFTQGVAGPHASMLLALHGADVIKIEPPEGDWGRALGELKGDHCAHSVAFNRGKRSIALDLKSADGIAVVNKLDGQGQRRDRELPARRHLAAGLRLRGRQEGQSQGRLLLGLGLRPDRALQQAADRRRADPGVQRHDGDEPPARRHAVAAGHDRRRRHDRPLHLPGAGAGADAPVALRRGLLHRFEPDALGRRLPGRQADGMGILQRHAAAALHAGRQLQDRRTATSWCRPCGRTISACCSS